MWQVAAELFLEGLLTPFLATALVLGAAHLVNQRRATRAPSVAIAFALVIAGLLAFGWPIVGSLNARTKVILSAIIGLALGALFERRLPGSRGITTLGLIGIALWIGEPALRQGRWESVLLIIPVTIGFLLLTPSRRSDEESHETGLLIPLVFAFGLTAITAFAKALSYSVLALALASALLAIMTIGRSEVPPSAAITAEAAMLALMTAVLLYTEASLPAFLVLFSCLGAEHLARLAWPHDGSPPRRYVLAFCIVPALLAILIARIDGGAISIY